MKRQSRCFFFLRAKSIRQTNSKFKSLPQCHCNCACSKSPNVDSTRVLFSINKLGCQITRRSTNNVHEKNKNIKNAKNWDKIWEWKSSKIKQRNFLKNLKNFTKKKKANQKEKQKSSQKIKPKLNKKQTTKQNKNKTKQS